MKCKGCGAELSDNVQFCNKCGLPIVKKEEDTVDLLKWSTDALKSNTRQMEENKPKKNHIGIREIMIITASVVTVGVIVIALILFLNNPNRKYKNLVDEAKRHEEAGEVDLAVEKYIEAAKLDVDNNEGNDYLYSIYSKQGDNLTALGKYEEAIEKYEQAREVREDVNILILEKNAYVGYVEQLINNSDSEKANSVLNKANRLLKRTDPESITVLQRKIKFLGIDGLIADSKYEDALKLCQEIMNEPGFDEEVVLKASSIMLLQDDPGKAIKLLSEKGPESSGYERTKAKITYIRNNTVKVYEKKKDTKIGYWVESYFDDKGRIISKQDSDGYTETYEYNSKDKLIRHSNSEGLTEAYEYNAKDELTSYNVSTGYYENYVYDVNDVLSEYRNSLKYSRKYEYNSDGMLIKTTDSNGLVIQYGYDEDGRETYYSESNGFWLKKEYDKAGHITLLTDSDGLFIKYSYNSEGLLLKKEYSSGLTVDCSKSAESEEYAYNEFGDVDKCKYNAYGIDDAISYIEYEYKYHFIGTAQ